MFGSITMEQIQEDLLARTAVLFDGQFEQLARKAYHALTRDNLATVEQFYTWLLANDPGLPDVPPPSLTELEQRISYEDAREDTTGQKMLTRVYQILIALQFEGLTGAPLLFEEMESECSECGCLFSDCTCSDDEQVSLRDIQDAETNHGDRWS